jgi:hypothetical protein
MDLEGNIYDLQGNFIGTTDQAAADEFTEGQGADQQQILDEEDMAGYIEGQGNQPFIPANRNGRY